LQKPKPPPVEKPTAKPSSKAPAKKGKQQASTSAEEPDEPPLSPTSEKIRQQRYMLFLRTVNLLEIISKLCAHQLVIAFIQTGMYIKFIHGYNVYLLQACGRS